MSTPANFNGKAPRIDPKNVARWLAWFRSLPARIPTTSPGSRSSWTAAWCSIDPQE